VAVKALSVYLGPSAARQLAAEGWSPSLFRLLLGASGGPKWFALSQLDRVLFGNFLQGATTPLATLGSSIGAWRNACLGTADPAAAIARMEQAYLHQYYARKPTPRIVSDYSGRILRDMLGPGGAAEVLDNTRIHSHIVTARGRGAAGARSAPVLAAAMAAAALGNSLSRQWLRHAFQRVVFHSGAMPLAGLPFEDFDTAYTPLNAGNLTAALHASGAIPFVLAGERDIANAPSGQYWDGGIIDYHFDLQRFAGDGLVLYPHFRPDITPGWFDKFLPWRSRRACSLDQLVLLCPSAEFVAGLPFGKIPDRSDFTRLGHEERVRYWEQCVSQCAALAEEFQELINGSDPLAGSVLLQGPAQRMCSSR